MRILNLSTLKYNDTHSYYGGAIGNIGYNLLSHLAELDDVYVTSATKGTQLNGKPPDGLYFRETDNVFQLRKVANSASDYFSSEVVLTHFYFHEPEFSKTLDIINQSEKPFVIGMCEAPHIRFSDELSGIERVPLIRKIGKRLIHPLFRKTLRSADKVVYVTPHAKSYYSKWRNVEDDVVIPYGVDVDRFSSAPLPEDNRILVVSRLIKRRGIQHLIKALPQINHSVEGVEVDIVGSGPAKQRLLNLAGFFGVTDQLNFYGNIHSHKLWQLYRESSVFCSLSYDDGFNQPALESMATSRSCVVTDKPHNNMVIDGRSGFKVGWGEPEAVGDSIIELLSDKEKSRKFGERGRGIVESHYSWPDIAERYHQAISHSF